MSHDPAEFQLASEPAAAPEKGRAGVVGSGDWLGVRGFDLRNCDCMDLMRGFPDNHFDLAITDPPYFENGGTPAYYRSRLGASNHKPITATWEIPGEPYFRELFRVSRRQIIWGCNYYAKHIPHCARIVWDKVNDNTPFSQAELASYSEGVKIWLFRYKWNGMLQQDMSEKEIRIHPTQKPVALYRWLLESFAKPGQRVLDTHLGSGSHAIACHYFGAHLTASELDADYFAAATDRIKRDTAQTTLFT